MLKVHLPLETALNSDHNDVTDRQKSDHSPSLIWQLRNRADYNPPTLYRPYDVDFLTDGRLALVEGFYPYSRINVFSAEGRQLCAHAQGQVLPFGLAVAQDSGHIAVTDHKDRTMKIYSSAGELRHTWPDGLFDWPNGVCIDPAQQHVVCDWGRGEVVLADAEGHVVRRATARGKDSGERSGPEYVTVDRRGRLVLTDTHDRSVKVMEPKTGKLLLRFGNDAPRIEDNIQDPRGVAVTTNNDVMVADWGADRVSLYSQDGVFIRHVLTRADDVTNPWGLRLRNGLMVMTEQKLNAKPALKLYKY